MRFRNLLLGALLSALLLGSCRSENSLLDYLPPATEGFVFIKLNQLLETAYVKKLAAWSAVRYGFDFPATLEQFLDKSYGLSLYDCQYLLYFTHPDQSGYALGVIMIFSKLDPKRMIQGIKSMQLFREETYQDRTLYQYTDNKINFCFSSTSSRIYFTTSLALMRTLVEQDHAKLRSPSHQARLVALYNRVSMADAGLVFPGLPGRIGRVDIAGQLTWGEAAQLELWLYGEGIETKAPPQRFSGSDPNLAADLGLDENLLSLLLGWLEVRYELAPGLVRARSLIEVETAEKIIGSLTAKIVF